MVFFHSFKFYIGREIFEQNAQQLSNMIDRIRRSRIPRILIFFFLVIISAASPNLNNKTATSEACPGYFRWIHEDLKPWEETGITLEMVERTKETAAHIRIVIVKGKLYVKKYESAFQTRDVVTIWGILQLLRLYPDQLPDMDFMFECGDKPVIQKSDYGKPGGALIPPPLFHYCGNESTFDIVFPDWSFWGWSELKIKPWEFLKKDLQKNNDKIKWMDRDPYAFWKGTAKLSLSRLELLKCNLSKNQEWNARIFEVVDTVYSSEGAMEVCSDMLICSTKGLRKKFRKHTMVNTVADSTPCILQPPFDQTNLQDHLKRKENLMKQVELWETSQDIRKE